jgi:hypothetical protein
MSERELAAKGYIPNNLIHQIEAKIGKEKRAQVKRAVKYALRIYVKMAQQSYNNFWKKHFEWLQAQGANINKLKRYTKRPAVT